MKPMCSLAPGLVMSWPQAFLFWDHPGRERWVRGNGCEHSDPFLLADLVFRR